MEPFLDLSAKNIKIAIRREIMAIDKFERRNSSKKLVKNNFMVTPKKIIGMVAIRIDHNIFLFFR